MEAREATSVWLCVCVFSHELIIIILDVYLKDMMMRQLIFFLFRYIENRLGVNNFELVGNVWK